jgi:dTDP-3,4-didehydro-2,6-dideoxy-alpha-D-glucose 3-reductase
METSTPPVRFGVIGCADIAWRRMLPALVASPGVRLVAVASRDEAKASRFAAEFGCSPVHGYAALLESSAVDAVYVPLPAMLHAQWIERALLAGKHVLAEKPMTADPESTARLLRLARSRGRVLLENVAFPHHALFSAVRGMLADGAIGELRDVSSAFTIPPLPGDDIRHQPEVGGGALLDMGIYPIRAALHLIGPEVDVVGAVLRQTRTGTVVAGRVLAHGPRGVTADLSFGMEHSYRSGYELAGSTGRLLVPRAFTPPPAHRPVVHVERQDQHEKIVLRADDQFANVIACFARAVRTGAGVAAWTDASLEQARLVAAVEQRAVRVTV